MFAVCWEHCVLLNGRKYQKSVEQLQASVDKMHKKGLTVEQYLSSVLTAVCVNVFMSMYAFMVSLHTDVNTVIVHQVGRISIDRSLWQVAPDNLKRFLEFGDCFRLCLKLAVSLQHCTPHVIVHWV